MDISYNFKINIAHLVQKVVHFCGKWYTLVKKTINFYGPINFFGNRKLSPKSWKIRKQSMTPTLIVDWVEYKYQYPPQILTMPVSWEGNLLLIWFVSTMNSIPSMVE